MIELQKDDAITEAFFCETMRLPGQPIVIRGGCLSWPCKERWSFQGFTQAYGDVPIKIADCLLRPKVNIDVPLREYLEYVQRPEGTRLQQIVVDEKLEAPLYAYGCKPFKLIPELREDFRLPDYCHDWCEDLDAATREAIYPNGEPWLLMSGKGARSRLHRDNGATIAWFAQLQGHKLFIVHPPSEGPFMYDGEVDPSTPDWIRFPEYAKAKPVRFTVNEGDLVYLPQDWYHYVRTESPSITLTGNLVNGVNFGDYLEFAYRHTLVDVLKFLPVPGV